MKFHASALLAACVVYQTDAFAFQGQQQTRTATALNQFPHFFAQEVSSGAPKSLSSVGPEPQTSSRRVKEVERNTGNGYFPKVTPQAAETTQNAYGTANTRSPAPSVDTKLQMETVQGGSLKTWSFSGQERVQLMMNTEGRPLNADIELWQGPDNIPQRMRVYSEDGGVRPFCAIVETPRGSSASIAVRNINQMEFPLNAAIDQVKDVGGNRLTRAVESRTQMDLETVQGGAIRTFPVPPNVASVKVMLRTDGRPLNARIEIMQGPSNDKQVIELYSEDGTTRPFFAVIDTPGSGNVVRIVNTAPMEFPLAGGVEAHMLESSNNFSRKSSGPAFRVY